MKNIKLRFSYFILIGILGFALQIISFLCFSDLTITAKDIMLENSSSKFYDFIGNNIVLMISCLCIITMFVGYYIGKKKIESQIFQLSTCFVMASQFFIFAITLVYLIFATVVRTQLFDAKTNNLQISNILVGTRYVYFIINYIAMAIFAFYLSKTRNNSKFSTGCNYVLIGINGLTALLFIFLLVTSKFHSGFNMITNLYELKWTSSSEIYPSFNGFTLAQLIRLSYIPIDYQVISNSTKIVAGSYFAISVIVSFVCSSVYNLFWGIVHLIESFDVDRDCRLMEI